MKVYVIEEFADYEGSQITIVFYEKDDALAHCKERVELIQKDWSPDKEIVLLPTGFKIGDRGVIYHERDVD